MCVIEAIKRHYRISRILAYFLFASTFGSIFLILLVCSNNTTFILIDPIFKKQAYRSVAIVPLWFVIIDTFGIMLFIHIIKNISFCLTIGNKMYKAIFSLLRYLRNKWLDSNSFYFLFWLLQKFIIRGSYHLRTKVGFVMNQT